jgi:large conductance mechanosensitive channel
MKKFFTEFKKFITRGNVVDMAIGVAVAGAFTKIVNAFTNGFVSPLIGVITGGANLSDMKWIYREAVPAKDAVLDEAGNVISEAVPAVTEVAFLWGAFVQQIVDFLIIAFVLFTVMKVFNALAAKAKEAADDLRLTSEEKAAIEAQKKAEADKKAAEEAAAKAAAEEAARKAEEEKRRAKEISENTEKLLTEIRDLLKNK